MVNWSDGGLRRDERGPPRPVEGQGLLPTPTATTRDNQRRGATSPGSVGKKCVTEPLRSSVFPLSADCADARTTG